MHNKRERSFLRNLCKGHIQDLIEDVGWNNIQKAMVVKRYLEFKSIPRICMETHQSETSYRENFKTILAKLKSYLLHNKDSDLYRMYIEGHT